jgi:hypothetical protein
MATRPERDANPAASTRPHPRCAPRRTAIIGPQRRAFWKKLRERADAGTLETPILLRLLEYRYGRPPAAPPELPPAPAIPADPMGALALKLVALPLLPSAMFKAEAVHVFSAPAALQPHDHEEE